MIRIGLRGQSLPAWLVVVAPTAGLEGEAKIGTVRFGSIVLMWAWRGQYYVRRLFAAGGNVIEVRDCHSVTISFGHPGAAYKPLVIDVRPLIPGSLLSGIVAVVILSLLQ